MHIKVYYSDKLWGRLEPIVHFAIESFSLVAADEWVDSAGDSEEDEPDPRVQQEVCSRNDDISNSTKVCDFL